MIQTSEKLAAPNGSAHVPPWVIERTIKESEFSHVFQARSAVDGVCAALKIARHGTWPADALESEITITPMIESAHILPVINSGRIDQPETTWHDRPFLVIPYAEGGTLHDHAVKEKDSAMAALRIVRDAARGLRDVHAQGYVHRDVKGENIFIHDNMGFIGDFGLVAHSRKYMYGHNIPRAQQRILGTLGYMSPEQYLGFPVNPEADIFGLGVTTIVTLTGKYPWKGLEDEKSTIQQPAQRVYESAVYERVQENLPKYLSIETRDIFYGCLNPEPRQRTDIDLIADMALV